MGVLDRALRVTSEGSMQQCTILWDIFATLQQAGEAHFETALASILERLESDYHAALASDGA
jgi:hypothetical protein